MWKYFLCEYTGHLVSYGGRGEVLQHMELGTNYLKKPNLENALFFVTHIKNNKNKA